VQKLSTQVFNGYFLPEGYLDNTLLAVRVITGSITPTQGLSKVARKPLGANITPSGAPRRTLPKVLSGALSMAGAFTKQRVGEINAVSASLSIETIVNISLIYEDKSVVLSIDGI
jgi:hypothetical protein